MVWSQINPVRAIDGMGITALGFEIGLGTGHKEAFRLVQLKKPVEVDVAAVHDVESAGLGQQQVQDVDVVQFAVADVEERRNVAAQIQQRVQFDGRLGRAKRCPGKYRQTQIDGAGIQSIDRVFQIDAKGVGGIKTAGDGNERLGKVGVDAPVAALVGIGQGAARYSALDTHVIELLLLGAQARFDVAQAFSVGQLSKRHGEVLVETRKAFHLVGACVARHASAKRRERQVLGDLREHQFALVHPDLLREYCSQGRKSLTKISNRDQTFS